MSLSEIQAPADANVSVTEAFYYSISRIKKNAQLNLLSGIVIND